MAPSLVSYDHMNRMLANTELLSQCSLVPFTQRKASTNGQDLLFSQTSSSIPLPSGTTLRMQPRTVAITARAMWRHCGIKGVSFGLSHLSNFVRNIIKTSSEEEMGGTDTCWGIATMQNPKPIRDWPIRQFPRNTMCTLIMPREFELSVSANLGLANPKPTSVCLGHLRPESYIEGNPSFPGTSMTTVNGVFGLFQMVTRTIESFSAMTTDGWIPKMSIGRMGLHADPPTQDWYVTPEAVSAALGLLRAHYSSHTGISK